MLSCIDMIFVSFVVRIVLYNFRWGMVWLLRGVNLFFFMMNWMFVCLLFIVFIYVDVVIVFFEVFENMWIFVVWVELIEVWDIIWGMVILLR